MTEPIGVYVRPAPADVMVIVPVDPGFRGLRIVDFDASEIRREGGDPRYDIVKRPYRKAAVVFTGWDPHKRRLDVLFDRWATDGSVLEEVRIIESWRGRPDVGVPPPRLRIRWGQWQDQLWTVARIAPVALETRPDGHPVRAQYVIDFNEAVAADLVLAPAEQADSDTTPDGEDAAGGDGETYVVKPGDTLSSIAAAELGDHSRWPEIAALNNLADPNVITVGQELKLP